MTRPCSHHRHAAFEPGTAVQGVTYDTSLPLSGRPHDPYVIRVAGQGPDEEAANSRRVEAVGAAALLLAVQRVSRTPVT